MNRVEIYYFSGTGNSLHVAREIQKRIPDTVLIPILGLLKEEVIEPSSGIVGLVFPIYLQSTPIPVRKFIGKIIFKPNQFLFAITTNCGYPGKTDLYLGKLLKRRGKDLDFYDTLKMVSNSPKGLQPSFMIDQHWADKITEKNISSLEENVQRKLNTITRAINDRERNIGKKKRSRRNVLFNGMSQLLQLPIERYVENLNAKIGFYTDSTCTGCGTCEQVCPSNKIKMVQGQPEWQDEARCYYCYACFNFCPQQSILVKNYTHKDGRFTYPGITAKDIADQKS